MTDLLDAALARLVKDLAAGAAVIWSARGEPPGGVVVAAHPSGLAPTGTEWPVPAGSSALERDPARLAALVPPDTCNALDGPPTAARTFILGDRSLSLLVVWCTAAPEDELTPKLQRLIDHDLDHLARVVEDSRFNRAEVARLRAAVNRLDEGVASVDSVLGQARLNAAAAALLQLPTGTVAASDFSGALARLASRALNHAEIPSPADAGGHFEQVWRFATPPTHLRVTSIPLQENGSDDRVWLFSDEFAASNAIRNLEQAPSPFSTTADALLDPLTRLSAVRDDTGGIVDFVFREANLAACENLATTRGRLLGASLVKTMPAVGRSGLLAHYIHCAETGESVVLNDFELVNDSVDRRVRYDVQATRTTDDSITLIWRDVTERYEAAVRMAESEEQFRLLAENSGDMVALIQDGLFAWVSPAAEQVLGAPPEHWQGRPLIDVMPPEVTDDHRAHYEQISAGGLVQSRVQMVGADGNLRWVHVNAKPFCDISGNESGTVISIRLVDHEVAAEQEAERARAARASIDARYRRLMESASVGMCITSLDGRFEVVNEALCDFLGYDSATLHTMTWSDVTPAEHRDGGTWSSGELVDRDQFRVLKQFVHADGHLVWGDVWASTLRDWTGRLESFIAQVVDVSEQVLDRHESARARRQQAEADLRYRRLTENSAIAICLIKPDGSFDMVNQAMCDFFGYDEAALRTKTWPELIPPDDVITDLQSVEEMLAGRIETYRLTKRYLHAEGRTMWGDLSVSCIRDDGGRVERFIAQIIDVTAEVEGRREILEQDESNRALTRKLQAQTDRLTAELNSAAEYIESLLPRDITGPPVRISSRYQPSDELAGDSHDYNWIDDDHLIVYLLDVSGHGVAAALLSISVHNMLRSASLPHDIMLAPDRLLGGLNQHFQMDRQGGNYFTMWYGVYQKSTRRLRYASAGHPPALMYGPGAGAVELSAEGLPIGMFDDAVFPTTNLGVAPGSRILLYSDGVYEWTLPDGRVWSVEEFIEMCERHAQSVGDWSLDTLVTTLRAQTPTETFEDDSSLVLLQFD